MITVERTNLGGLVVNQSNKRKHTKRVVHSQWWIPEFKGDLLRNLAANMELASSNDVNDTLHWLQEHTALVGLAAAVEWYARCAMSRDNDPFVQQLDWKQGIVDARRTNA